MVAARIGGIGDLLVEIMATGKNGHHLQVETYRGPFPSGSPGIFIDQAAHIGGDCIFVGTVGDDAFGQVIVNRLTDSRVDTSLVKVIKGVPTGTAFVSYNDDGSRDFVFNIAHSAASRLVGDDATITALKNFNPDYFHVSGTALADANMCANVLRVVRALHLTGARISFDPNVRKELMGDATYFSAMTELIGLCSIFLPSADDATMLFPGQTLGQYAPPLLAAHADYVVLKKGAQGCEAIDKSGAHINLAAHNVSPVDPTGAGDCFGATFVTLIAGKSMDMPTALAHANAAGALAVTKLGPMEGNSDLPQIKALFTRKS